MGRKPAKDLRENPTITMRSDSPELPVNTAISQLTKLEGTELEISTRTSPQLARAASVGYIYTTVYGSEYVRGRVEQIERLAISNGGQGRTDLIEAVKAGGRMPDAYMTGGKRSSEYSGVWEVND